MIKELSLQRLHEVFVLLDMAEANDVTMLLFKKDGLLVCRNGEQPTWVPIEERKGSSNE